MARVVKSSIILALFLGLLLEISGSGISYIISCSETYNYKRCLKIGNDDPRNLMKDFYSSIEKGDQKNIDSSWNILSVEAQEKYEHQKEGIIGKNYFFNFWGLEVENFTILKSTYEGTKFMADMTFTLCYKRNSSYAKEHGMPLRHCSHDTYHLIKKREDDSPYLWSMDTHSWKNCEKEDELICNEYDFSKI